MSSSGRRRKVRSRPGRPGVNHGNQLGFPAPGPNRFTVEGYIDAWGDFARGARRSTGARGVLAKGFALLILASLFAGVVGGFLWLLVQSL